MSQPPNAAAAARASAARVLDLVVRDGRTLEDALAQQPVPAGRPRDGAVPGLGCGTVVP